MRRVTVAAALGACALLAAACGKGASPGAGGGPTGVLTIANANGSPWTCGFNPFNGNDSAQSLGPVYEPLAFVNALRNGATTPWLATSWRWGEGNRALTFTIRRGVRFSNGMPMDAADVVFSFRLLDRFGDLDQNGVWSVLSGVTQSGPDQVVMRFKTPDVPMFYDIADQVPIVPRQVWSTIKDPATYTDAHPVGTGAYTVASCSRQDITYQANPHYWTPGEPHVARVVYPAFTSNNPATTFLATGLAQWGGQFIPNIGAFYLSQSPDFHYWFPPLTDVSLVPNLANPLLANVKVRQAMAYAIDRRRVASLAEYGYERPANQAGVVTPTFSAWLDGRALAAYGSSYDPGKARQLLASAGFHPGKDGVMTSSRGQRLDFTVLDVAGYSDWEASVDVIAKDLRAVGIDVHQEELSYNSYDTRLSDGRFQLGYYAQLGGPTPYYELSQWLATANGAPLGVRAGSNYERYTSAATDRLLSEYTATTSLAAQHRIVQQLQLVMLRDVPYIPVTEAADWFEYSTGPFAGWPTSARPYAQPSPYVSPDWGQVLLHLAPK